MNYCCPKSWLKIFKAMADPQRQTILGIIHRGGVVNITEIVGKTKLTQPTVSHHIKVLEGAGLVGTKKEGKELKCCINKKAINDCCEGLIRKFED